MTLAAVNSMSRLWLIDNKLFCFTLNLNSVKFPNLHKNFFFLSNISSQVEKACYDSLPLLSKSTYNIKMPFKFKLRVTTYYDTITASKRFKMYILYYSKETASLLGYWIY